jgi:hypothetical protein
MGTILFSTFALVSCAFLIYVWFRWLREELDLKKPAHRDRRRKLPPPPYVIRKPHHGISRYIKRGDYMSRPMMRISAIALLFATTPSRKR